MAADDGGGVGASAASSKWLVEEEEAGGPPDRYACKVCMDWLFVPLRMKEPRCNCQGEGQLLCMPCLEMINNTDKLRCPFCKKEMRKQRKTGFESLVDGLLWHKLVANHRRSIVRSVRARLADEGIVAAFGAAYNEQDNSARELGRLSDSGESDVESEYDSGEDADAADREREAQIAKAGEVGAMYRKLVEEERAKKEAEEEAERKRLLEQFPEALAAEHRLSQEDSDRQFALKLEAESVKQAPSPKKRGLQDLWKHVNARPSDEDIACVLSDSEDEDGPPPARRPRLSPKRRIQHLDADGRRGLHGVGAAAVIASRAGLADVTTSGSKSRSATRAAHGRIRLDSAHEASNKSISGFSGGLGHGSGVGYGSGVGHGDYVGRRASGSMTAVSDLLKTGSGMPGSSSKRPTAGVSGDDFEGVGVDVEGGMRYGGGAGHRASGIERTIPAHTKHRGSFVSSNGDASHVAVSSSGRQGSSKSGHRSQLAEVDLSGSESIDEEPRSGGEVGFGGGAGALPLHLSSERSYAAAQTAPALARHDVGGPSTSASAASSGRLGGRHAHGVAGTPTVWRCRQCTCLNADENKACEVCSEPLQGIPQRFPESWVCPQCTVTNTKVLECAVCEYQFER